MAFADLVQRQTEQRGGNPINNPAVSLSSPAIWSWLTNGEPTAAGEEVNHHTAMQAVSVYACVRVIAESVASLPLKLYAQTSAGRVEAHEAPLHDLLCIQPNEEMSAFSFWETMTGCLALTGNCYAQIIWQRSGQIDSLIPLHPLKTEPYRRPDGKLAYRTTDGEANGQWRSIAAADCIAVPLFSYDGLKGLSPIMQARQAIGLTRAAEKFGARFFGNGSRPGGVMSTASMPDEKAQQNLRESWEVNQSGASQGKTAFLFGDWKYQQIGLSPEESQFLATRKFQREDIAALFRVPASMVGDTSRLSNSNHEQQNLTFLTDTIRPYLARLENELTRKILPSKGRNSGRYSVAFDVTERLRGDFATMQKGFQTGVLSGWLSRNDVRKELGENPGPAHLDVYMVPVNMQNSERLLDTEPITDQPIGGPKPDADEDDAPTTSERSALTQYRSAYLAIYRDAFGRLMKRDKRDLAAVQGIFRPVMRSIATFAADSAMAKTGLQIQPDEALFDGHIETVLRSMAKRAQSFTAEDIDALAGAEFTKAVRSLHLNTHRDAAAASADAELTPELE